MDGSNQNIVSWLPSRKQHVIVALIWMKHWTNKSYTNRTSTHCHRLFVWDSAINWMSLLRTTCIWFQWRAEKLWNPEPKRKKIDFKFDLRSEKMNEHKKTNQPMNVIYFYFLFCFVHLPVFDMNISNKFRTCNKERTQKRKKNLFSWNESALTFGWSHAFLACYLSIKH